VKRYSNINKKSRYDGKQIKFTTYYPEIPQSDSDIYIISNETDYLDTLAYKYYRDPTLWFIIALANNIGHGRMSIPPGIQLRIPTNISAILSDFDKVNS